jgi:hypothetical protein
MPAIVAQIVWSDKSAARIHVPEWPEAKPSALMLSSFEE